MADLGLIPVENRVVEHPNRYKLELVNAEENIYDLVAMPGAVAAEGTMVDKALLEAMQTNALNAVQQETQERQNDISTVNGNITQQVGNINRAIVGVSGLKIVYGETSVTGGGVILYFSGFSGVPSLACTPKGDTAGDVVSFTQDWTGNTQCRLTITRSSPSFSGLYGGIFSYIAIGKAA